MLGTLVLFYINTEYLKKNEVEYFKEEMVVYKGRIKIFKS